MVGVAIGAVYAVLNELSVNDIFRLLKINFLCFSPVYIRRSHLKSQGWILGEREPVKGLEGRVPEEFRGKAPGGGQG